MQVNNFYRKNNLILFIYFFNIHSNIFQEQFMEATIPLDKMSVEEKIKAMEIIWDDLRKNASNVPSPEWHKHVLNERENALKSGEDRFIEWDKARKKIIDSIQ